MSLTFPQFDNGIMVSENEREREKHVLYASIFVSKRSSKKDLSFGSAVEALEALESLCGFLTKFVMCPFERLESCAHSAEGSHFFRAYDFQHHSNTSRSNICQVWPSLGENASNLGQHFRGLPGDVPFASS